MFPNAMRSRIIEHGKVRQALSATARDSLSVCTIAAIRATARAP
jgi:hypothetical protein